MPKFSQQSLKRLATCHPDLQLLFKTVVLHHDCTIIEGYRGKDAQEAAFSAGNSQLHYPNSLHNSVPSIAVDVAPYPLDWKALDRFTYFAGVVMGIACILKDQGKIKHDVRWGGDWGADKIFSNDRFRDFPHYELIGAR